MLFENPLTVLDVAILFCIPHVRFSPPICSSYSIQTGSGLSLRGESLYSFEIPRESSLGYCNRDVQLCLLTLIVPGSADSGREGVLTVPIPPP